MLELENKLMEMIIYFIYLIILCALSLLCGFFYGKAEGMREMEDLLYKQNEEIDKMFDDLPKSNPHSSGTIKIKLNKILKNSSNFLVN